MAEKKVETPAPADGAIFMHLDDFLNTKHDEIKGQSGLIHVESLTSFGRAKQAQGIVKQTEEQWRADYEAWLKEVPQ